MGGDGSVVRRKRSGGWEMTDRLYEGSGAENERCLIVCTMLTGRRMGGNESFVRRNRSRGWEVTEWRMGGDGSFVRRKRSGGWEGTEHLYEGKRAGNGRNRSFCTKVTERLYGTVGEKSIDFLKILYRLSSDTL